MEKLNEIKETYAKELGYKDWVTCINDQPNYKVETLMDEVALRLYNVVGQSEQLVCDACDNKGCMYTRGSIPYKPNGCKGNKPN